MIFRVHSEAFRSQVFLFTAEPYSDFRYLVEQMRFEVTGAKAVGIETTVFVVGLNFMSNYWSGKFSDSLVIVMGCRGLYNGSLIPGQEQLGSATQTAEWFLEQGAIGYISWDGLVDLSFSDRATVVLLEAIYLEKMNLADAVEKVNNKMGPDPYRSELKYIASENITN